MTTTHTKVTHGMMAIGTLVLTMATAAPTYGKSARALTIRAVEVSGNAVVITVTNNTGRTQTGRVDTHALTIGGIVRAMVPVTAPGGHTVTVRVVLPDRVLDDGPLGVVVDDGVPF